jgi:chromosome segregation ATPase/DNA-directed RNA polymerase subunit RPC12/RpoP
MDTSTEIKFECEDCGQRILVDAAAAGMNLDCPSCRATVLVPKSEAEFAAKRHRDGPRRASGAAPKRAKSDAADRTFADPEISSLRQELVEASTQITHAEGELDDLRAQLAAARADAERFQASGHSAQAENKSERLALRNEVAQLKQRLELVRAEADQARAEANGLTGELAISQRETETVRQQLHDREIEFAEVCTGLPICEKTRR